MNGKQEMSEPQINNGKLIMEIKRNSIIAAAVCLAALASCQKQEIVESPSLAKVDVELTASSDLNSTKTVMTEYNNHWWSVSDKISLFYKVDGTSTVRHSVFTSKNLIPSATARFAGTLSLPAEDTDLKTVSAIAVYPTAAEGASSDGTSVTVTVPAVQTAVEGTFMEGAYPVVAQTSDLTAALSFKAVCGGVKVSFQTPGITSFTFDGKDSKIAGTASVTFDTDGNPVATTDESAVSEITVNAPAGGFEVGKWYYMTALPATLAGGYTITLSNGKSFGSTSSIAIKRSVFGVLDAKDVETITYAPLADKLKPISWWDGNKDYMAAPVHAADKPNDQYQWKRNISCIRFESNVDYIYGYFESTGDTDLNSFKNLGIWLDVDGPNNGIGGWVFNAYPHFDKVVYGSVGSESNMIWKTKFYPSPTVDQWNSPHCGNAEATASDAGYGEGSFENGVFKYSFIIDRRIVGLRNASSAVVGICLDNGNFPNGTLTNPDRAGYIVMLKNSLADIDDNPNRILNSLKSISYWDSIEAAEKSGAHYDKGNTIVKFDSDARFIYGYFEANSDNMFYGSMFCPSILKKLAVCIDTDGVTSGQGPNGGGNVSFGYGGYDVVLNGATANTTITDYKDWKAVGWAEGADGGSKDNMPEYNVSPIQWNPKAYDMSQGIEDSWGKTVLAGTENKSGLGIGNGTWDSTNKIFKYTFAIDREKLNLLECEDLNIGIAFYRQDHNGLSCLPSYNGFTIKLNNN